MVIWSGLHSRFIFLTRDNGHWRQQCYDDSKAASQRRREELISHQSAATAALARAVNELPASRDTNAARQQSASQINAIRLANWDPTYPNERSNFYQEYVHRHAPIRLSWFEQMNGNPTEGQESKEATGAGVLYDVDGRASKLYAPLDDGSIGVWEAGHRHSLDEESRLGRRLAASRKGTLRREGTHQLTDRDNGVVESLSIDSHQRRGYFAVGNDLVEADLETLQSISRHSFSRPISVLSEARAGIPLTVGTTFDLHMFDSRVQHNSLALMNATTQQNTKCLGNSLQSNAELIHTPVQSCATLSQPGPLSILLSASARSGDSIWVGGRFTHLLNYDRRFFPRLRGTIHSGARISSLTSLPYPYVRRVGSGTSMHPSTLARQDLEGSTLIAAGAYKGKGSLEMYGLSTDEHYATLTTSDLEALGRGTFTMTGVGSRGVCAQNRQTASSSKLLSVANHGLKLVYTDGDAKIKWIERDGFTAVREFSVAPHSPLPVNGSVDHPVELDPNESLWARNSEGNNGDIVQKLIPTLAPSPAFPGAAQPRLHEDNLIIWTGDGRLGMLGFGKNSGWDEETWREMADIATAEHARLQEEREHAGRMRRALQWQADEARFMTGLGLPSARSW